MTAAFNPAKSLEKSKSKFIFLAISRTFGRQGIGQSYVWDEIIPRGPSSNFRQMKSLRRILRAIHNLPEEVRKLLAGFFLLMAAVLLFNNWAAGVSSDLTLVQLTPAETASPEKSAGPKPGSEISATEPAPAAPAPFESIADSVKSLEKLIKGPPADTADSSKPLGREVKEKVSDSVAGLYAILEKTWKYVYEPLR